MPPKRSNTGRKTRNAKKVQVQRAEETNDGRQRRLSQVREATHSRRSSESRNVRAERQSVDRSAHPTVANLARLGRNPTKIGVCRYDEISEADIPEHCCGEMNIVCTSCGARNFAEERTGRNAKERETFSHCCEKGKVNLPNIRITQQIRNLLAGNDSSSKHFVENIRKYNSALAFASMGAKLAPPPTGRGPFCFRIHGQVYHRTSPLHPAEGGLPKYAQIYILDAQEALNQRMAIPQNIGCKEHVMKSLGEWLLANNELAKAFKMMREVEQEEESLAQSEGREVHPILMSIRHDRKDDQRRCNAPRCNEIAIVFKTADGAPPFERDIRVHNRGTKATTAIPITHRSCDPMIYPILFPHGDDGRTDKIPHAIGNRTVTQLQWYAYHMAVREQFNQFLRAGKLTQQFWVDAYAKVEACRLDYIRRNQKDLRVEQHDYLKQYLDTRAENAGMRPGKTLILPSSFHGSPRAMNQNYQDAMAIVRKYGKPDLFITMTCNPNWKEVTKNLNGQPREGRPDLVARVFQLKLKELMDDLLKKHILGVHVAKVHVIEFQKRGLPHAHILLILRDTDKPKDAALIDQMVSAEIPNPETHPRLHAIVLKHMVHGPCGKFNKDCPCMDAGKCTKDFPKDFSNETNVNVDGYPKYRRLDTGAKYPSGSAAVDNSWIVPYNPFLALKYNCHINVEVCASIKSVKYLFKYVYKGHDCANIDLREKTGDLEWNEISNFMDARYISAPEAVWRLRKFNMHEQTHSITRLKIHLPGKQPVVFVDGQEGNALANSESRDNTLTAWFKLNSSDSSARNHLYPEIPEHFKFDQKKRAWHVRKGYLGKVIGRMYSVSATQGELYYLRLLLLNVRGATSFADLKSVDGHEFETFKEAAIRRHLLADDSEWENCLEEAQSFQMPRQLRHLFAYICVFCEPQYPNVLWENHKAHLIEDFIHQNYDEATAVNYALVDIQGVLAVHGKKCTDLRLPDPLPIQPARVTDTSEAKVLADEMIAKFNDEQRIGFEKVKSAVSSSGRDPKCFYLDGAGGCGKTFLYEALFYYFQSLTLNVECVASTGIAATLLPFGRTYHSAFKLPVPLLDTSTSSIRETSPAAQALREAKLIVWDEVTITPFYALDAVDKLLRSLMNRNIPFGGKVILLGGDFRQCLPVVPHAHRAAIVQSCIKSSALWENFRQIKLTKNMRTGSKCPDHDAWLIKLGNGELTNSEEMDSSIIEIPSKFIESGDLIDTVYGESITLADAHKYADRAILTPKNDDVHDLNAKILQRLEGETFTYLSMDSVSCDDDQEAVNFPVEFLNTVRSSGLPLHRLELKVGAVIMLLRNLNTRAGLCNGTRLIVKSLKPNLIDAEVLTGRSKGQRVFIPRIDLKLSDGNFPFQLLRRQFPVMLAFVMTINKSQGQSLEWTGIYLPNPVFSHGQLYVAFSRGKYPEKIKVKILETVNQGRLVMGSDKVYTVNCIYREVLEHPAPTEIPGPSHEQDQRKRSSSIYTKGNSAKRARVDILLNIYLIFTNFMI